MALDQQKIQELHQLECEVELFKRSSPQLIADMTLLIGQGEFSELAKIAHKMKNRCFSVGVLNGYSLCLRLEIESRNQNKEFDYLETLHKLKCIAESSISVIEGQLQKLGATA